MMLIAFVCLKLPLHDGMSTNSNCQDVKKEAWIPRQCLYVGFYALEWIVTCNTFLWLFKLLWCSLCCPLWLSLQMWLLDRRLFKVSNLISQFYLTTVHIRYKGNMFQREVDAHGQWWGLKHGHYIILESWRRSCSLSLLKRRSAVKKMGERGIRITVASQTSLSSPDKTLYKKKKWHSVWLSHILEERALWSVCHYN